MTLYSSIVVSISLVSNPFVLTHSRALSVFNCTACMDMTLKLSIHCITMWPNWTLTCQPQPCDGETEMERYPLLPTVAHFLS